MGKRDWDNNHAFIGSLFQLREIMGNTNQAYFFVDVETAYDPDYFHTNTSGIYDLAGIYLDPNSNNYKVINIFIEFKASELDILRKALAKGEQVGQSQKIFINLDGPGGYFDLLKKAKQEAATGYNYRQVMTAAQAVKYLKKLPGFNKCVVIGQNINYDIGKLDILFRNGGASGLHTHERLDSKDLFMSVGQKWTLHLPDGTHVDVTHKTKTEIYHLLRQRLNEYNRKHGIAKTYNSDAEVKAYIDENPFVLTTDGSMVDREILTLPSGKVVDVTNMTMQQRYQLVRQELARLDKGFDWEHAGDDEIAQFLSKNPQMHYRSGTWNMDKALKWIHTWAAADHPLHDYIKYLAKETWNRKTESHVGLDDIIDTASIINALVHFIRDKGEEALAYLQKEGGIEILKNCTPHLLRKLQREAEMELQKQRSLERKQKREQEKRIEKEQRERELRAHSIDARSRGLSPDDVLHIESRNLYYIIVGFGEMSPSEQKHIKKIISNIADKVAKQQKLTSEESKFLIEYSDIIIDRNGKPLTKALSARSFISLGTNNPLVHKILAQRTAQEKWNKALSSKTFGSDYVSYNHDDIVFIEEGHLYYIIVGFSKLPKSEQKLLRDTIASVAFKVAHHRKVSGEEMTILNNYAGIIVGKQNKTLGHITDAKEFIQLGSNNSVTRAITDIVGYDPWSRTRSKTKKGGTSELSEVEKTAQSNLIAKYNGRNGRPNWYSLSASEREKLLKAETERLSHVGERAAEIGTWAHLIFDYANEAVRRGQATWDNPEAIIAYIKKKDPAFFIPDRQRSEAVKDFLNKHTPIKGTIVEFLNKTADGVEEFFYSRVLHGEGIRRNTSIDKSSTVTSDQYPFIFKFERGIVRDNANDLNKLGHELVHENDFLDLFKKTYEYTIPEVASAGSVQKIVSLVAKKYTADLKAQGKIVSPAEASRLVYTELGRIFQQQVLWHLPELKGKQSVSSLGVTERHSLVQHIMETLKTPNAGLIIRYLSNSPMLRTSQQLLRRSADIKRLAFTQTERRVGIVNTKGDEILFGSIDALYHDAEKWFSELGDVSIADFKTTAGFHSSHIMQVGIFYPAMLGKEIGKKLAPGIDIKTNIRNKGDTVLMDTTDSVSDSPEAMINSLPSGEDQARAMARERFLKAAGKNFDYFFNTILNNGIRVIADFKYVFETTKYDESDTGSKFASVSWVQSIEKGGFQIGPYDLAIEDLAQIYELCSPRQRNKIRLIIDVALKRHYNEKVLLYLTDNGSPLLVRKEGNKIPQDIITKNDIQYSFEKEFSLTGADILFGAWERILRNESNEERRRLFRSYNGELIFTKTWFYRDFHTAILNYSEMDRIKDEYSENFYYKRLSHIISNSEARDNERMESEEDKDFLRVRKQFMLDLTEWWNGYVGILQHYNLIDPNIDCKDKPFSVAISWDYFFKHAPNGKDVNLYKIIQMLSNALDGRDGGWRSLFNEILEVTTNEQKVGLAEYVENWRDQILAYFNGEIRNMNNFVRAPSTQSIRQRFVGATNFIMSFADYLADSVGIQPVYGGDTFAHRVTHLISMPNVNKQYVLKWLQRTKQKINGQPYHSIEQVTDEDVARYISVHGYKSEETAEELAVLRKFKNTFTKNWKDWGYVLDALRGVPSETLKRWSTSGYSITTDKSFSYEYDKFKILVRLADKYNLKVNAENLKVLGYLCYYDALYGAMVAVVGPYYSSSKMDRSDTENLELNFGERPSSVINWPPVIRELWNLFKDEVYDVATIVERTQKIQELLIEDPNTGFTSKEQKILDNLEVMGEDLDPYMMGISVITKPSKILEGIIRVGDTTSLSDAVSNYLVALVDIIRQRAGIYKQWEKHWNKFQSDKDKFKDNKVLIEQELEWLGINGWISRYLNSDDLGIYQREDRELALKQYALINTIVKLLDYLKRTTRDNTAAAAELDTILALLEKFKDYLPKQFWNGSLTYGSMDQCNRKSLLWETTQPRGFAGEGTIYKQVSSKVKYTYSTSTKTKTTKKTSVKELDPNNQDSSEQTADVYISSIKHNPYLLFGVPGESRNFWDALRELHTKDSVAYALIIKELHIPTEITEYILAGKVDFKNLPVQLADWMTEFLRQYFMSNKSPRDWLKTHPAGDFLRIGRECPLLKEFILSRVDFDSKIIIQEVREWNKKAEDFHQLYKQHYVKVAYLLHTLIKTNVNGCNNSLISDCRRYLAEFVSELQRLINEHDAIIAKYGDIFGPQDERLKDLHWLERVIFNTALDTYAQVRDWISSNIIEEGIDMGLRKEVEDIYNSMLSYSPDELDEAEEEARNNYNNLVDIDKSMATLEAIARVRMHRRSEAEKLATKTKDELEDMASMTSTTDVDQRVIIDMALAMVGTTTSSTKTGGSTTTRKPSRVKRAASASGGTRGMLSTFGNSEEDPIFTSVEQMTKAIFGNMFNVKTDASGNVISSSVNKDNMAAFVNMLGHFDPTLGLIDSKGNSITKEEFFQQMIETGRSKNMSLEEIHDKAKQAILNNKGLTEEQKGEALIALEKEFEKALESEETIQENITKDLEKQKKLMQEILELQLKLEKAKRKGQKDTAEALEKEIRQKTGEYKNMAKDNFDASVKAKEAAGMSHADAVAAARAEQMGAYSGAQDEVNVARALDRDQNRASSLKRREGILNRMNGLKKSLYDNELTYRTTYDREYKIALEEQQDEMLRQLQELQDELQELEDEFAGDKTFKDSANAQDTAAAGKLARGLSDVDVKHKGKDTLWGQLGSQMTNMFTRFTQMGAAYKILGSIRNGFNQVIQAAKNLDKAMTDLRIVTGKNREEARATMLEFSDLAKQLGVTTNEVATSATAWLRQGYDMAQVNDLVTSSMYLSKLGMISVDEATKDLTKTVTYLY